MSKIDSEIGLKIVLEIVPEIIHKNFTKIVSKTVSRIVPEIVHKLVPEIFYGNSKFIIKNVQKLYQKQMQHLSFTKKYNIYLGFCNTWNI